MNFINKKYNLSEFNIDSYDKLNQWFSEPTIIDCTDLFEGGSIREISRINKIIIHHDSIPDAYRSMIVEINEYHIQEGLGSIAYHFWIDKYGTIYQCHNINEIGKHCLGQNAESIGICLNGNFDEQRVTELQFKALIKLLVQLTDQLNIPHSEIYGHNFFRETNCPGKNINIDTIQRNVFNYHFLNNLIKSDYEKN